MSDRLAYTKDQSEQQKYFCHLEIDHVTQYPKETCQRTSRGPSFTKMGADSLAENTTNAPEFIYLV